MMHHGDYCSRGVGAARPMNILLVSLQMLLPLEIFAAVCAPEGSLGLLSKMRNLVMSRQSFFSGVGLCAACHLAAVNGVVRVDPAVALEVLLPRERLFAVGAVVNAFYLLSASVALLLAVVKVTLALGRLLNLFGCGRVGECAEEMRLVMLLLLLLVDGVVVPQLPAGEGCVVGGLLVLAGVGGGHRGHMGAVLDHLGLRMRVGLLLFVCSLLLVLLVLLCVGLDGQHRLNVVVALEALCAGDDLSAGLEGGAGRYSA